jgi:hypothetical protein
VEQVQDVSQGTQSLSATEEALLLEADQALKIGVGSHFPSTALTISPGAAPIWPIWGICRDSQLFR